MRYLLLALALCGCQETQAKDACDVYQRQADGKCARIYFVHGCGCDHPVVIPNLECPAVERTP